jgi:DNA-binding transcriptional MerR regulator/effector-binding domain-containing protein
VDVDADLTIGDFSRITHLSIRTLRRYHEAKLLEPARVDRETAYRYYSLDQVPTAQVIHRFRQLGMPVREVGELVGSSEPTARAALIAQHLERLEAQLDQTRAAVVSLRRLLRPDPSPLEIRHRRTEATTGAAVHGVVDLDKVVTWYDEAMVQLDSVLAAAGAAPLGPPGGLYENDLFTEERGAVTVYVPVADPPARGVVQPFVVPSAELATVVHCGPHDDIDVTYATLGTHVCQHALEVAGPVREIYHVGPRDTDDTTAWRTEIGWPIFETAPRTR